MRPLTRAASPAAPDHLRQRECGAGHAAGDRPVNGSRNARRRPAGSAGASPAVTPAGRSGRLLTKLRVLFGEAWRFGVVGVTNLMINFVVFNALAVTLFRGGELKANVVATAFATTTSYLMNRGWTFRHRKTTRIRREYVLFFLFNGVGLAIELAVMALAKYGFGLTGLLALNLAKVAGIGLATVFRFWTYRTFVFSGRPASVGAPPAEPAGEVEPDGAAEPAGEVEPTGPPAPLPATTGP